MTAFTKMKHLFILLSVLIFALPASAQRGAGRQNIQRVQAAKVGLITERVNLTGEQAERFWPVYHRYEEELRLLRREAVSDAFDKRSAGDLSEAESRRAIEERLERQEGRLAIQRKYKDQFLRVISAQQLVALYDAEREFNRLLVQRVRQQRAKRQAR